MQGPLNVNTSSEFLIFACPLECDTVSFPTNGKTEVLHQGQAVFVRRVYNTINIVCKFVTDNFWYETDGKVYAKRMLFSITKLRIWSFLCFHFPTEWPPSSNESRYFLRLYFLPKDKILWQKVTVTYHSCLQTRHLARYKHFLYRFDVILTVHHR